MVGWGSGRVDLAGIKCGLLGPVVLNVDAVERKPVLACRLIESVWHLKPGRQGKNGLAASWHWQTELLYLHSCGDNSKYTWSPDLASPPHHQTVTKGCGKDEKLRIIKNHWPSANLTITRKLPFSKNMKVELLSVVFFFHIIYYPIGCVGLNCVARVYETCLRPA